MPTPGPVLTPPSLPRAPTSPGAAALFSPPPLPDHVGGAPVELVLETELDFSLEASGSFPSSNTADQGSSSLANLFDGIDLGAPPITGPSATMPAARSGAGGGGGLDVVGAFAAAETSSLPAPPPPPLPVRLLGLAERLRAEGREDDANTVEEALDRLPPT
ncbi:MAG: hypothetical protein IT383_06500 [Deltaproteobacteria bacterium]|nr:hypothetical protein [Deltaproteobacteria bacterium]